MTSQPRQPNAPPSSFARRTVPPSTAGLSPQEKGNRRVSRVDMDFEQALKAGGTVVLEEGRRLDSLGLPSPSTMVSSSVRTTPTKFPVQPATPTVVPPTPTARRPQRKKAPDISQALAAATAAGPSSPPSSSDTPTAVAPLPQQTPDFEDLDDYDPRTRRRSLFRSPGTSSSPDLATLVKKARERGGVVGSSTLSTEPSETSILSLGSGASPTHLSPILPSHPPTAYSNGDQRQRSRTQSTTSGSSSYSFVDSPGLNDDRIPGTLKVTRTGKADKVLGVNGGPMGSMNLDDKMPRHTIRSKTSALWTKMTGSTRRPSSNSSRTVPSTPISPQDNFAHFAQYQSPSNTTPTVSIIPPGSPEIYYDADDGSTTFKPKGRLSKPLPPINTDDPGFRTKRSQSPKSRRRSMSVDAVDLGQILRETDAKPHPALPPLRLVTNIDRPVSKALPGPPSPGLLGLGGWTLNSESDLNDFRGAFAGLTAAADRESQKDSSPKMGARPTPTMGATELSKPNGRPRARSDLPAPDLGLGFETSTLFPKVDVATPAKFRPTSTQSMPTRALIPAAPVLSTQDDRSFVSERTAMPSSSDHSTYEDDTPEPSTRDSSPQQPSRRLPGLQVHVTPSHGFSSEPSLVPDRPLPPRRGSEDVAAARPRNLANAPYQHHRSIRANHGLPFDPSASSLAVNVSEYSTAPTSTTNSASKEDVETKAKIAAERCWNEDEMFLAKEKIAEWLGGTGAVNKLALARYLNYFDFKGFRLDNAFRHLCGKLYLKGETQQVDRILENFGRRYWECNPDSLFGSPSVVHSVSYSLLLLNTDLHVAELASHMSKTQFVRNTLFAITEAMSPSSPTQNPSARSSTPDLFDGTRQSGEASDHAPSTVRMRSKRSGSIHSWKSDRETVGGVHGNASTPALISSPGDQYRTLAFRNGGHPHGRAWEHDMENMLKDMYTAVKQQQILQPVLATPSMERQSTSSLTPGSSLVGRSRSQRSYGGSANLKRGSIRGIQTLLGSQSPYSSNSSSTDGRVSPSPSFATSVGEAFSASSSSLYAPTLGFASNLSHTIIKEAQEDDLHSLHSVDTDDTSVSITDEELALQGPPWAKEGMLCRKFYYEALGKRAKDKNWQDVFVVIQKGELMMFTFGEGGMSGRGGGMGGGNWLSNATPMGTLVLAHSFANGLPPPGYNRSRPHCFVLTLPNDTVYFFQAGTEDLVNEWVSTCNYWAARTSKEPLAGGVSNMEYGWSRVESSSSGSPSGSSERERVDNSDNFSDVFSVRSGRSKLSKRSVSDAMGSSRNNYSPYAMEKIHINDWKPPMPSTVFSTHDEEMQLEALQRQVAILNKELVIHQKIQLPMLNLYQPRSPNYMKASTNWDAKRKHLTTEIVKYDTYVDCLRSGMALRIKKRGEKVLERNLVSPVDEAFASIKPRTHKKGLQDEPIQETEEPTTPGPGIGFSHKREVATVERRR